MNQNKPKILYVITQSEWGGAQKYIYDLVTDQNAKDFEVMIAVGQGKKRGLIEKLKNHNINIRQLKHLVRPISPLQDFLAILELKKLYQDFKPNIIHLNSTKAGIIGSLASKFNHKLAHLSPKTYNSKPITYHLIYTVHGWVFNEPMSNFKKSLYTLAEKLTAKYKDKIICISKLDYQLAIDNQIATDNKLALIYNGLNSLSFLSKKDAEKLLKVYYSSPATYHLVTIANFYATKGLQYLLEAIYLLKTNNIPIHLTIIGDGKLRPQLENLIANFGIQEEINLVGQKKDGYKYLKAFDAYVCSSVKEGLPYSILEAMQAELPIISTSVGGIGEMVENGKTGILIEPKKPKKIAGAIKYIIENPEYAKKLGQTAKQIAISKFSKNKMAKKTFALYNSYK